MLARYSDLQDAFRRQEGYSIDLKITTVLRGLGFSPEDLDKPSETFSGGWQMRIALAKLLLGRPGLLLLDEPTNHLDLEARNWLEEYLNAYPHAVILVSHDRFFLDAVVTRIADLTLRTLTDYHTNYRGYLAEHHERIEAMPPGTTDHYYFNPAYTVRAVGSVPEAVFLQQARRACILWMKQIDRVLGPRARKRAVKRHTHGERMLVFSGTLFLQGRPAPGPTH